MAIANIKNQTLSKTNIQESDNTIQLQFNIEVYNEENIVLTPDPLVKDDGYEFIISDTNNIINFN